MKCKTEKQNRKKVNKASLFLLKRSMLKKNKIKRSMLKQVYGEEGEGQKIHEVSR